MKNLSAEDVIPIFLLLQLDHYSNKLEQFDTLAVFIEKNGAPDYIVIMEAGNKGFVNDENIKIVKRSKLFPKVTSSDRVEIYMSDKKPDKDDE